MYRMMKYDVSWEPLISQHSKVSAATSYRNHNRPKEAYDIWVGLLANWN